MTATGIALFIALFVSLVAGLPIAISFGAASYAAIMVSDRITSSVFIQRMFTSTDNFPLMAIIFFIMAGEMMMQGGISRRLINFALSMFGWMRGSLAMVNVVACTFFGAISGSAYATVAAIGGIMYPEMIKRGYKEDFTATLNATAGILGILIPPSIPLVLYGVTASASISDLFLAVIGSGISLTILYMICAQFIIRKENMAPISANPQKVYFWASFKDAFWGLLTPVIILGGIYSGIFTPTESAVIATVYAMIVGKFVYRELNFHNFYQAMGKSVMTASSIMFIVAGAQLFTWIMTMENIPNQVSGMIIGFTTSKVMFLILTNVILLIAGMFIDTSSIVLIMAPLLMPVAAQFGVDIIHFGVIMVINVSIGLITPPFGGNLFISASMTKVPVERIYRRVFPFIAFGIIGIALVTFIPALSIGFLQLFK